jgi:hypothetical protein
MESVVRFFARRIHFWVGSLWGIRMNGIKVIYCYTTCGHTKDYDKSYNSLFTYLLTICYRKNYDRWHNLKTVYIFLFHNCGIDFVEFICKNIPECKNTCRCHLGMWKYLMEHSSQEWFRKEKNTTIRGVRRCRMRCHQNWTDIREMTSHIVDMLE